VRAYSQDGINRSILDKDDRVLIVTFAQYKVCGLNTDKNTPLNEGTFLLFHDCPYQILTLAEGLATMNNAVTAAYVTGLSGSLTCCHVVFRESKFRS